MRCLALIALLIAGCGKGGGDAKDHEASTKRPGDNSAALHAEVEDRNESLARLASGQEAVRQNKLAQALTDFRAAVAADDGNHAAWYEMGRVMALQDNWQDAQAYLEKATKLEPDAMYIMWAGIAAFERGEPDKAAERLHAALEANGKLYRARDYLGRIHEASGKPQAAAASWTQACRMYPQKSPSCLRLAKLYLRWDDIDRARQVLEQATQIHLDPIELAQLHHHLGLIYEMAERWDDAIDQFTKALEQDRYVSDALLHRALAYHANGDQAQAQADAKRFLTANSNPTAFQLQQLHPAR
jgi:tetratricopeptide (TPR) repeat protein